MSGYTLARSAEDDLLNAFSEGLHLFGLQQAEVYVASLEQTFDRLVQFPRMGREIVNLSPVRSYPHKAHIILYRLDDEGALRILRVRHAREDWTSDPLQDD